MAHLTALAWWGHIALANLVIVFRAIKNAGIADAIQFDDVPMLRYLDTHFDTMYWWLLASGIGLLVVILPTLWWRTGLGNPLNSETRNSYSTTHHYTIVFLFAFVMFEACLLRASQPYESAGQVASLDGVTPLDWAAVFALAIACLCVSPVLTDLLATPGPHRDLRGPTTSRIFRNGFFYLFGCAAVFLYAWIDHVQFWDPEKNGGYKYAQFFLEEELPQARLVLYSTSILFATLAAVGGVVIIALFRLTANHAASVHSDSLKPRSGCGLMLLSASAWSLMLNIPWQIKIWPEIDAERGWILPVVTMLFTAAAILPAMQVSWLAFTGDFREFASEPVFNANDSQKFVPRPSELALWNFVLFPVYPLLSLLRLPAEGFDRLSKRAGWTIQTEYVIRGVCLIGIVLALFYGHHLEFWSGLVAEYPKVAMLFPKFKEYPNIAAILNPDTLASLLGMAIAFSLLLNPGRAVGFLSLATVSSTIAGYLLTMAAYKANSLYTFDDWRGMLKSGLFPFLRVSFALLSACVAYIVLRRVVVLGISSIQSLAGTPDEATASTTEVSTGEEPQSDDPQNSPPTRGGFAKWTTDGTGGRIIGWSARLVTLLLVGASLGLATWPFWGWQNVRKNVFARAAEYNTRHDFELRFLHWMFDFDRDGYSALLHGADPDDFDADALPGGIAPPRDDNAVPIDNFIVAEPRKAQRAPSLMILFLEGVTRESIYAYGKQCGPEFRKRSIRGTPNMDGVAADGTIFTQARCFYPSTWDAWYSTITGRFLRIKEMDMSRGFGNRYSRYGNLYKVMQLAGIRRYCHSNTDPFFQVCVPMNLRKSRRTNWMPNFDSTVSEAEEKQGIWRGDKRNDRMLKFLDSLKPGERFFVAEHMSDTHFPWNEVPGFEWASGDAVLKSGSTDRMYSHYFQTIARMDKQIGELVDKLKQLGRYDDTMIVIVSDHGCQWWEHEHMYYVSHLYDPAIIVPMIIKIPGIKGGRVVKEPVLQVDVLPTYMEVAGVKHRNPHKEYPFTGLSLAPLMRGTATDAQRQTYWNRDVPLTTHYDKLGVISQFHHKLIFNRPVGTYKLFDLQADPEESKNLADEEPELLQRMIEKLREQLKRHPAIIGGIRKDPDSPED